MVPSSTGTFLPHDHLLFIAPSDLTLFDCLRCWFAAFPLCVSMVMYDSVETGSELFFQFGS